jgi:hypothetical protein
MAAPPLRILGSGTSGAIIDLDPDSRFV